MSEKQAIIEALRYQTCELRDIDVGWTVPRVTSLTSLEFLRDYVASNKPVIFTQAITHWPALTQWTKEYLIQQAGNDPVTVALTPDGRADCPTKFPTSSPANDTATTATVSDSQTSSQEQLCFAFPYERKTSLATFFNLLETSLLNSSAPVPYMQFQNSSLTKELPHLVADVSPDLPFASEAFGQPPEAVNLWIGGKRSITSWHKDHYENLYAMVSGRKSFRLLPPTDSYRMNQKRFSTASWDLIPYQTRDKSSDTSTINTGSIEDESSINIDSRLLTERELESGKLKLKLRFPKTASAVAAGESTGIGKIGDDYIIWSGIIPTPLSPDTSASHPAKSPSSPTHELKDGNQNEEKFDLFNDPCLPEPLLVTLEPGEVLYLPACWWHEVHHTSEDPKDSKYGSDNNASDVKERFRENEDPSNTGIAIAVNYWYDQKFDTKYVNMNTVEKLAQAAGLSPKEILS